MSVRVLLIDDSKAVVRELRSLLSLNPGWLVCGEGINGVEAVEKARSLRPDLILMDISMPQMNGSRQPESSAGKFLILRLS